MGADWADQKSGLNAAVDALIGPVEDKPVSVRTSAGAIYYLTGNQQGTDTVACQPTRC